MDDVALYHGDCLDILRGLEPGSVDAVVCDPPYGVAYRNRRGERLRPQKVFAHVMEGDRGQVGQQVIDDCRSRGWPVCAFAHHRHPWRGKWRQYLVWDKGPGVGGGGDIATCWKFTWELIQVGGFGRLVSAMKACCGSTSAKAVRIGTLRRSRCRCFAISLRS